MLVVFENQVYDITNFISEHPGGKHVFEDLDNHDITPLVYSYHNNVNKIKSIMKKYKSDSKINAIDKSEYNYELYIKLKKECLDFLGKNNTKWSRQNTLYNLFLFLIYLVLLRQLIIAPSIIISILYGVFGICWTGLVQHEASHNAISHSSVINNICRYIILPFGSPGMWNVDHNISHHPHTNTDKDRDFSGISHINFGRFTKTFPWRFWYVYQVWYLLFFINNLIIFLKGIVRSIQICLGKDYSTSKFSAFIHILSFFALFGYSYMYTSILYPFISFIVYSNIFMIFSQVNHISRDNIIEDENRKNDFCINQIEASCNYETNPVTYFLSFGLYAQIEHHLFPSWSHEHYPKIMPIVKRFCKEHNIKYTERKSFYEAFMNYIKHINFCGQE
jgi:linoleoyl-CoA desaturase